MKPGRKAHTGDAVTVQVRISKRHLKLLDRAMLLPDIELTSRQLSSCRKAHLEDLIEKHCSDEKLLPGSIHIQRPWGPGPTNMIPDDAKQEIEDWFVTAENQMNQKCPPLLAAALKFNSEIAQRRAAKWQAKEKDGGTGEV